MKNSFVALVVLGAATALAMPTPQELKKAQPLVAELMAPTMDDYKAKKKTAEEVADESVKYAGLAETEAAKFMLYRSAIPYYVRSEAYDKAADAVVELKTNVKDVPAEVVAEIISKATVRASWEKAPRLFALYQQVRAQVTAEKDVRELRKKPASPANRRKLAEALATAGDWPEALKEFADLGNDAAQMAKRERDGSGKSYELGEFWWAYEPAYENAKDVFRIYAVTHYRRAIDAGEITGLKKPIVEQRIAEYEAVFRSHSVTICRKCQADGSIGGLKKSPVEKRCKQMNRQDAVSVTSPVVVETKLAPKPVAEGQSEKERQGTGDTVMLEVASRSVPCASSAVLRASCSVPRASCSVPRASCSVPRASGNGSRACVWVAAAALIVAGVTAWFFCRGRQRRAKPEHGNVCKSCP